jgi:peptidoglycan hydrolase-like protein with peptidoglycan-binding domain
VRNIQGRLKQLGYYSGGIDGVWGPEMQSALARFQQGQGLQATGQINPATVTAMGLDANNLAVVR